MVGDRQVMLRDDREKMLKGREFSCNQIVLQSDAGETHQLSHFVAEHWEGGMEEVAHCHVLGVCMWSHAYKLESRGIAICTCLRLP